MYAHRTRRGTGRNQIVGTQQETHIVVQRLVLTLTRQPPRAKLLHGAMDLDDDRAGCCSHSSLSHIHVGQTVHDADCEAEARRHSPTEAGVSPESWSGSGGSGQRSKALDQNHSQPRVRAFDGNTVLHIIAKKRLPIEMMRAVCEQK